MRGLWPGWTIVAPAPFVVWCAVILARGELRWEVVLFLIGAPVLAYATPRTKRLFVGAYPAALVGLMYDALRYVEHVGLDASRVHICDLRAFDARWFGLPGPGGAYVSWSDVLARHDSLLLDAYCAIPYGTFLFLVAGYAIYLFTTGDDRALARFAWAYFLVNLAGFVTYHLVPAAPPWYVHAHGCAFDPAAAASEGPKLARVDALLGFSYFGGLYGRASDVYGAIPSLHAAYPLLVVLEGWRRHRWLGRSLSLLFFGSMAFAAVWLDHHWITDVVLGVAYGGAAYGVVAWALRRSGPPEHAANAAAPSRLHAG